MIDTINNYSLLPEWHNQQCILLTWPHKYSDWAKNLINIEKTYFNIVKALFETERLIIIAYDDKHQLSISNMLKENHIALTNITFFIQPTDDTWIRDYGPLSLTKDNKLILLNCVFDGWNTKYNSDKDNAFNKFFFKSDLVSLDDTISIDAVLEGGSLETNGIDTLVTTKSCLLSRNHLSIDKYNSLLSGLLGVKDILWLENSFLEGDDTDGHIDNLVRFVNSKTLVFLSCDDPQDKHYKILQYLKEELFTFNERLNNKFQLIPLPLPKAIFNNKHRLPASYINFIITNNVVLVPVFNQSLDEYIINILQQQFNNRRVIGIDANTLIMQGGGIHCATMQIAKL